MNQGVKPDLVLPDDGSIVELAERESAAVDVKLLEGEVNLARGIEAFSEQTHLLSSWCNGVETLDDEDVPLSFGCLIEITQIVALHIVVRVDETYPFALGLLQGGITRRADTAVCLVDYVKPLVFALEVVAYFSGAVFAAVVNKPYLKVGERLPLQTAQAILQVALGVVDGDND